MKKNFTRDSSLLQSLFLIFQQTKKQGEKENQVDSSPEINYEDSDVLTGEITTVGSVYKFPMVTPGLEAMVTITGQKNAAESKIPELQTETVAEPGKVSEEGDWVSFKIDIRNTGELPQPARKNNFKISLNNLF